MIGIGLTKGLIITLKNFIRPPFTVQYPDRRVGLLGAARAADMNIFKFIFTQPGTMFKVMTGNYVVKVANVQSPRFRGNEFTWLEDRCTGCASCAKYCPLGIIEIITSPGGINAQEGESYAIDVFDIDIGRCMFCGLCVEACPYDALHMGTKFERSRLTRSSLVINKQELNENVKTPSSWFRPQLERDHFDPYADSITDHHDAGRHEKPDQATLDERWVDRRQSKSDE